MGKENFKASKDASLSMSLNPLAWTLWGLDGLAWAAGAPGRMGTPGPTYKKMSKPVAGTEATRRRAGFVEKLDETPFEGLTTGYDLVKRSYETYVSSRALSTRPVDALCGYQSVFVALVHPLRECIRNRCLGVIILAYFAYASMNLHRENGSSLLSFACVLAAPCRTKLL